MRKIRGGLYLVVDPAPGLQVVLPKIELALKGGADVIQIWDNWSADDSHEEFVPEVCRISHAHGVPVVINNKWQWLEKFPIDGVHFDTVPGELAGIRNAIKRNFFIGVTCGNAWEQIDAALRSNVDYISFCSVFPSETANSCELVNLEIVKQVRAITSIPIYVAGGITTKNLSSLLSTGIDGVAIASGIMKADDVQLTTATFRRILENKTESKTKS